MEFLRSKYLVDIAHAIEAGRNLSVGKAIESPLLCRCPNCHLELLGYQRHKNTQKPFINYLDEDLYFRGDPILLPEVIADKEAMGTEYFGMNAGLLDGICPQCGNRTSQVWFYRFMPFPKPNLYSGHMPGSENLYQYDPANIVKEFERCDLRLLLLNDKPIGTMLFYTNALVVKSAFHGWPDKDFRANIVAFFIDSLITRDAVRANEADGAWVNQGNIKAEAEEDSREAEVVVRELNRLAQEYNRKTHYRRKNK